MTPEEHVLTAMQQRYAGEKSDPAATEIFKAILTAAVRAAVLEEREAAAKVAKDFPVMDFPADRRGSCRQVRHGIAEAIQGRPTP